MGIVVSATRAVPVDVRTVFAYMDDYRNVPAWLFGIKKFEPVTDQVSGKGAVYDGAMSLGVTLKARVECVDWEQDRLIELDSIKGFKTSSRWLFEQEGEGTRVSGTVEYDLPFGPAGKALGKTIEPFVKIAVAKTADDLEARLCALEGGGSRR